MSDGDTGLSPFPEIIKTPLSIREFVRSRKMGFFIKI